MMIAIWRRRWLWCRSLSGHICWIEDTFLLLWCWRIWAVPEAGRLEREHNSGGQWRSVMWFRMNISAFISFLWMTPFSSLFGFSHVGNGRVWNWILYTLRWLYKGIIQDGYCTITNVMKLAQRWQLYRGRSLLIYGDLLQYNIWVCQPWRRAETSLDELSSLFGDSQGLCVCSSLQSSIFAFLL